MKDKQLTMKKKRLIIIFGFILVCTVFFTACNDVIIPFETQAPVESEHGKISFNFTGGEALSSMAAQSMVRTAIPSKAFDRYEYAFTRVNGSTAAKEPDSEGFFTLEVGIYTVKVNAYIGTNTLVASGTSAQFNVAQGYNDTVEIQLTETATGAQGEFSYTISYPAGSDVEITLQKWPGLVDVLLDPVSAGNGKSQTLQLDAGSYLLNVLVNKDELYAGISEAIHVYPSLSTEYVKNFSIMDFLDRYNITVTNITEWNNALDLISNYGSNDKFVITINDGGIPIPVPGSTAYTFGSASNVTVTINGNGKLYLTSQGSLLNIDANQTVYIDSEDLTLEGYSDNLRAVVTISGGILELKNGTISGNTNASQYNQNTGYYIAGGVSVFNGGLFTMSGGFISGNKGFGGVYVTGSNTSFTMLEGTISDNTYGYYYYTGDGYGGSGVFINNGSSFIMLGGTINDNKADGGTGYGGGVTVLNNSKFKMEGGVIKDNNSEGSAGNSGGGGVSVAGSFIMSGGSITGNFCTLSYDAGGGGGVAVSGNNSTFIMSNGNISANTIQGRGGGGGVHVSGGIFTMSGGIINNNNIELAGGGVLVTGSGSSFNMEGGTISNNSSRSGGGVYTSLGCYFTMSGGTIKGNSASECGGGVFALDITKTGGIINGYTYGDTDSNTVISNGTVLNNWGHAVCVATFAERRRESTAGILVNLYSNIPGIDGGWENGNSSEVSFNVSNSLEFDTALAAIRSGSPGDYDITLTANISLAPQNFVYNAYNTKTITIKGNNAARTISLSSQGSLFTIGGLYEKIVLENIILQGIVNNTNALISVTSSGTLTMNAGAKITGNTSGSYGGVYVSGGTFNMTGGEISGNNITSKSEYDGGAGVHLDGINYNTIFTMTGGTISANTSGANGGGVYLVNSCIFNMEGGTISGNSSNLNGGGVFLRPTSGTTFTMSGGEISGNTAVQGGGVFVTYFSYNNNHFIKSGGGIIYGNNEGSNSNTAKAGNGNGHAVYWDPRYRDTTLGAVDNISNDVLSSPPWNQ